MSENAGSVPGIFCEHDKLTSQWFELELKRMPPTDEHEKIMKGMLSDLEDAIKDFMRVATDAGMSKAEINAVLKRECDTTIDEVIKAKIIH